MAGAPATWQCNPPQQRQLPRHTYLRERLQQLAVDLSDGVERHVHFDQLRADACAPMRRCDRASVQQRNGATMQQCHMSATRLRHAHEPIAACGAVQGCRASAAKRQRAPSLCMTAVACRLCVVCRQWAVARCTRSAMQQAWRPLVCERHRSHICSRAGLTRQERRQRVQTVVVEAHVAEVDHLRSGAMTSVLKRAQ